MRIYKKIVAFLICLVPLTSVAQLSLNGGIKLGGGSSKVNFKRVQNPQAGGAFVPGDAKVSFHGGAFVQAKVLGIVLRPELYFTSIGSQAIFESQNLQQVQTQVKNYNINRIDLPLLVGIGFAKVLRINAGPVLSATATSNTTVNEKLNSATVGFQAGLGIDVLKFGLDVRYETGISKVSNQLKLGNFTFPADQRISQFLFSLSYRLF
ncbi:MAG: outer membrane beta-barrel protein [Cytophagales bacterium]|nr:PorT family protein [Bernardetiaceae bacterium]MDW8211593.1 outer membrane beta-barrel protein [Cytophagales bacterium]